MRLRYANLGYPAPGLGRTVFHVASRAIAANLLFTAGPFADYYLSVLLGRRSVVATGVPFALGGLFSLLLVPLSLSRLFWEAQFDSID